MNIKLSENIKRLRRERGVTQEELSQLLGVSCAAVSKWERGESYPDITLLFPLAEYFGVSIDELMGYNKARREEELRLLFEKSRELFRQNKREELIELMTKAHREFPKNHRVTMAYMWAIAGDYADNDPAVLREHAGEFLPLCDDLLMHCTDNRLCLDAHNLKAKIFHAQGRTEEAVAIYRDFFPDWYQTTGQKTEQLFAKNTEEFHYQLIDNMIELLNFAVNKKLKEIWYCKGCSLAEKIQAGLELGQALADAREKYGYARICYIEYAMYGDHAWKTAYFGGAPADIAVCLDKALEAAARCDELCKNDEIFRKAVLTAKDGKVVSLVEWKLRTYDTTEVEPQQKVREMPECAAVLEKYRTLK